MSWREKNMTEVRESTILSIFFGIFATQQISALVSDETFSHFSKVKFYARKLECGDRFLL